MTATAPTRLSPWRLFLAKFELVPALAGVGLGSVIVAGHGPVPPLIGWVVVLIGLTPTAARMVAFNLHSRDALVPGLVKGSLRTLVSAALAWAGIFAGAMALAVVVAFARDGQFRATATDYAVVGSTVVGLLAWLWRKTR